MELQELGQLVRGKLALLIGSVLEWATGGGGIGGGGGRGVLLRAAETALAALRHGATQGGVLVAFGVILLVRVLVSWRSTPRRHCASRKREQLVALRKDLREVMEFSLAHPLFLRLAWSDACTYDDSVRQWPQCGGANGSIRSEQELAMPCNAGLSNAIVLLEPLKKKFPDVSWADLIQMAGALAVELCGGPRIELAFGRVDASDALPGFQQKAGVTPTFREPFPDGAQSAAVHLRTHFYRMGFNNRELVALCGAHTIGRAFKDRSGACPNISGDAGATRYTRKSANVRCFSSSEGGGVGVAGGMSWTERWMCFDNSYFQRPRGHPQGIDSKELLWLPTDRALHEDPELRVHFERYAVDQALFFRDYAAAHRRMSELGCRFEEPGPTSVSFPPL